MTRLRQDLGRVRFVSGWRHELSPGICAFHNHQCVEIVYHPTGTGWTETEDGYRLAFSEGATVVYPPAMLHNQMMKTSGEDIVVQMETTSLPRECDRPFCVDSMPAHVRSDLLALSAPPATRAPLLQTGFDFRSGALLCALLDLHLQTRPPVDAEPRRTYATAAYRLICERYASLASVADLAESVGIGYDHLRHLFQHQYGMTLQECLIHTRIERAKELLCHSNMPLKAIAPLCGFGTDRHMCTVFRARVGTSPGRFRTGRSFRSTIR